MKAVLELELIGDNLYEYQRLRAQGRITKALSLRDEIDLHKRGAQHLKPWVARVVGVEITGRVVREFVQPMQRDYSQASSNGSRGIMALYVLGDGIYEVNERISWGNVRHYFLRVVGAEKTEITLTEVLACLKGS